MNVCNWRRGVANGGNCCDGVPCAPMVIDTGDGINMSPDAWKCVAIFAFTPDTGKDSNGVNCWIGSVCGWWVFIPVIWTLGSATVDSSYKPCFECIPRLADGPIWDGTRRTGVWNGTFDAEECLESNGSDYPTIIQSKRRRYCIEPYEQSMMVNRHGWLFTDIINIDSVLCLLTNTLHSTHL